MTSTKHILLAAAALLALATPALAGDGDDGPFPTQGHPQVFEHSVPRLDLGSEAYPTTAGLGADSAGQVMNHITRDRVPAYQRGFDVGSEAYPEPR